MSVSTTVNGALLRQRIHDGGYVLREFAARTGIGEAALRNITRYNRLNNFIGVGTVLRVLREAAMSADELFNTPATNQPDPATPNDAAVLAQALTAQPRRHPRDNLCQALGWTFDRLDNAIAALNEQLSAVGLHAHTNSMGTAIRATDQRGAAAARNLQQLRESREGLPNSTLRSLYNTYKQRPQSLDHETRMHLAHLENVGYIRYGQMTEKPFLDPDVSYALNAQIHNGHPRSVPVQVTKPTLAPNYS